MITKEILGSKSAEEIIASLLSTPEYCHVGMYNIDGMTFCGIPRDTINIPIHKGWTTSSIPNFCPVCGRKPCPQCIKLRGMM